MLRYFCLWDDRQALFGDRRPYRLHYFLEDGSCEILETREANSGREPFPVFLRRGLLPKVRQHSCCMPKHVKSALQSMSDIVTNRRAHKFAPKRLHLYVTGTAKSSGIWMLNVHVESSAH